MDFSSSVYLEKYLSSLDDSHPLLVSFKLNDEYRMHFDKLLGELDSVPNLIGKIKILKDASNWESTVSELEFARSIKALNPEFIQEGNKPDLKITLNGESIFFEVKLLADIDEANRIYRELWAMPSDFVVKIEYTLLDKREKADAIIDFVASKIKNRQTGSFSLDDTEIEIQKKKTVGSERTWLMMTMKEAITIDFDLLRRKIFKDFWDKIRQFLSEQFVFWVIDVKRWQYGEDDYRRVVYGNTVEDLSVGMTHFVGFEKIYKAYEKNRELVHHTGLIPSFHYPEKDGLFFLDEASCLDGVIIRSFTKQYFLANPFSSPQLRFDTLRTLKRLFNGPLV
jgi:hypothetical protein